MAHTNKQDDDATKSSGVESQEIANEVSEKTAERGVDEVKSQLTNHWDLDQLPRQEYERLMSAGTEQRAAIQKQQVMRFLAVVGAGIVGLILLAVLLN